MSEKFKHKPDKGTVFPNKFKKKPTQPDYIGKYTDETGKERDVALWDNGSYFSISFKDVYVPPES